MYPVTGNFHTLAIQDSPKTRCRIYFIDNTVDCTDDNDVQTNGTLLVGAVGDTDSNGRIGQNGVVFNELFNPDKNIQIGRAVSSQIGMTLLNTDGALDNFAYGRCKVYLDVYDAANTAWLSCPMGVYIIELPTKRKVQLINAVGFDQMTKLDEICDTWWNGLNWSGGLTLLQIVNSMATQLGVSVSSNTASAIVNGSLSYTAAPFDCVEVTYREVLEVIAEATGTVARFDRNGALDLRYFELPTINGVAISIDTDTVGNQCLGLDVAEYNVSRIDLLRAKFAEGDIGVTVGSGTNEYVIQNNLFLNGANTAAITNKLTPIYNRLYYFIAQYTPVSGRFIWDWSIEAGDMVYVVNNGTMYTVPIFQQTMTWRGGYVVSDLICDGDKTRPVLDSATRDYYRLDSDMRTLVIEAPRINLLGYTTINNGFKVNLDGTFEANGATIYGDFIDTITDPSSGALVRGSLRNGRLGFERSVDNGMTWANVAEIYDGETSSSEYSGYINIYGKDANGQYVHSLNEDGLSINSPNFSASIGGIGNAITLYESDGVTPAFLAGQSSALFDVPVSAYNGLSVTGATSLTGDATVGGVLTVTNRIAEAILSSAGWYRVLTFAGTDQYDPLGLTGALIRFNIERYGNTGSNGNHQIDLSWAYNHREFVNEFSNGADVLVDKIRATTKGNEFYVDIHFAGTSVHRITVDFDVKSFRRSLFTTNGLEAVADSPSGETIITTYTFGAIGAFFGDLYTNGALLLPFLTKGTAIPSNANMNTYTTPGVYYATTAVASTLSNANITTVAFKLIVMPMVGSDVMQIHMADWDNCVIAMRRYNGSTWSGYRRITPVSV